MSFPDFFNAAPVVRVRDPLAEFLGAADGGVIDYRYEDAVRLAGHSCPAVAGAYLMVSNGLTFLYDDELPERGNIAVTMSNARDYATTGVLASIAGLLTGAATEMGFAGIGPNKFFARKDLLDFDGGFGGTLALRRRDTGRGVMVDINTDHVPHAPEMAELLPLVMAGKLPPEKREIFGQLWQDRVRRMLVDHADDPKLIHLYEWQA